MTYDDFLLHVFYLIDREVEAMKTARPQPATFRSRGPQPVLHDSEVITMETVGEYLGLDRDEAIYRYFIRHHRREFPKLPEVARTTFARQSANLWRIKQLLHERILRLLPPDNPADELEAQPLWLLDSFPLRVCRFKRASGHKLFRGLGAAYGRDPTHGGLFYGYRLHLRCRSDGAIAGVALAPGDIQDADLAAEIAPPEGGTGIGDRGYWDPVMQTLLLEHRGFELLAPFRKKSSDPWPQRSRLLGKLRQIIEPLFGQLAVHFHCQVTWARDLWHLCVRLGRKFLSHTIAVLLNLREGHPPLQLHLLLSG